MTAAVRIEGALSGWAADHPEWWCLALSVGAWSGLLWRATSPSWPVLCSAAAGDRTSSMALVLAVWRGGNLGSMLLGWAIMTAAMVPPLAVPLLRHVAERSYGSRRHRAMAAFLGGVAGAWWVAGLVLVPAMTVPAALGLSGRVVAGCALVAAAAWQVSPMKRRALQRCHRTFPLAASGWRADRDCVLHGLAHGADCLMSCGMMMVAAMLGTDGLIAMVVTQMIGLAERRRRLPGQGRFALVLAVCGALAWVGVPV